MLTSAGNGRHPGKTGAQHPLTARLVTETKQYCNVSQLAPRLFLVGNENGCTKGLVRSRPYLTAHWRHPDCRAAIKKAGDQCAVR